jgi:hypothetical protein
VSEPFSDQLKILRERIPIGVRHGLSILEKTNGDLVMAEILFREDLIAIIVEKTGVDKEMALRHLVKSNFDIEGTLASIDEERFTLSERILRRYKADKEEALAKIADAIEKKERLKRTFWLEFEDLKHLSSEAFCLLTVKEWINYESWEGLDSAVYFNLEVVADQIEKQLLMPEVAQNLRTAKQICQQQFEQQKQNLESDGFVEPTQEFTQCYDLFMEHIPLIIDKLYEYVRARINLFP